MITELQQQEGSTSDDKKKVIEMLQRIENEPEDDDEEEDWDDLDSDDDENEGDDLADRLAEVDLNNADAVWERLTDEEKQEFKSIVYNGEIEKIVQAMEPWWKHHLEAQLVKDVKEEEIKVKELLKKCPKVYKDIKDFHKISTKAPAPCITFNIANVIGAYTYIFHYYNGDHASYELEAADNLITICDNLKANSNFESVVSVADAIMMSCHNANLFADLNTREMILEDLKDIFDGPSDEDNQKSFLLSALSDVASLFKSARSKQRLNQPAKDSSSTGGTSKKFSSEFISGEGRTELKQLENQTHFVGCMKKIEFYLSFVKFRYNRKDWPVSWEIV